MKAQLEIYQRIDAYVGFLLRLRDVKSGLIREYLPLKVKIILIRIKINIIL